MPALHTVSMLVKMTVHKFGTERIDSMATQFAIEQYTREDLHGVADPKVLKYLLPKIAMKEINDSESELRRFQNTATLPWGNGGWRLLPSAMCMKYTEGVRERKTKFDQAVGHLISNYDYYKGLAISANKLCVERDYPTADEVRDMFEVEIAWAPTPSSGDFRLFNMEKETEEVRVMIEKQIQQNISSSMNTHYVTLLTQLNQVCDAMSDSERRLVVTSFDTLRSIAELGQSLEGALADDSSDKFYFRILQALENVTMDELRHDPRIRQTVNTLLKGVINDINKKFLISTSGGTAIGESTSQVDEGSIATPA